jgi:hypothetical protein
METLIVLGIIWILTALVFWFFFREEINEVFDGVLFLSPLNLLILLLIIYAWSAHIYFSVRKKIRKKMYERKLMLIGIRLKDVDPYGEENWGD